MTEDCAFCDVPEDEVIAREGPCFAIWTGEAPAGSAMVLPRVHRRTPWELTDDEWAATRVLLSSLRGSIAAEHEPDGWNIGWNVGEVGGQSVPHAHCHLVPRYADEAYAGRGLRWWFKQPSNIRPS
ncbi:MAG: HIT family protein [Nocardioides sp.]